MHCIALQTSVAYLLGRAGILSMHSQRFDSIGFGSECIHAFWYGQLFAIMRDYMEWDDTKSLDLLKSIQISKIWSFNIENENQMLFQLSIQSVHILHKNKIKQNPARDIENVFFLTIADYILFRECEKQNSWSKL